MTDPKPFQPPIATRSTRLERRAQLRQLRLAEARRRAWREEGILVLAALALASMVVWGGAAMGWGLAWLLALVVGLATYTAALLWRVIYLARALPITSQPRRVWGLPGLIQVRQRRLSRRWSRRQRRLVALLKRYHHSAMTVPDAMVVLTDEREIEWLNRAAIDMLGLNRSDIGLRLDDLWRTPAFIAWLKQGSDRPALELVAPADETRTLSLRIEPYGSDRYLLIGRDVTALHRLQGVRQDFVANVSHELRTPLTVLAGYVETLLDTEEGHDPQMHRILSNMHQQADRMRRIVEDLLLLSRLETSQPDADWFEAIDVARLVEPILNDARLVSGEEGHDIRADLDPALTLWGVPRELQSAFSNLVFNAVKYTPAGGRVDVRWGRDDQGRAVFSVCDSGIGIEARHIPRLTERFYRIDVGRSRSRGGTGLGLAIVKHVALRHGARLEIDSTPGEGSCFRVIFPVPAAMQAGRDDVD
ncbi:phosphate regulon sensor histidine kinase PhoR [Guyparkeria halophila]|uniref:Phosphate regulon sensor protein PhoR n=1 Tax=Guyparkeria halophila TaxID=47960 RepID=A0ABZ0YYH6_9GAMM|nr:phosphate regulon sensor histidine kinase PhoR [Guyparkeria halophila]WQH16337.1 phosphate regulon sensor histidine kinase PhoR [Guyparkeria halophila]